MRAVENFFIRRSEFKVYHRNFLAFSSSWFVRSNSDRAFEHRNGARVAIPHLDRVIAEKAVPAEHLHAFVRNPHRLLAGVGVCELRLPGCVAALLENRGGLP